MGVGIEVPVRLFSRSNWKKVVYRDTNRSVTTSSFPCNFDTCTFWIGVLSCSEKCSDVLWASDHQGSIGLIQMVS